MQYAQPLIWEARIFTNSSSDGSRPESFTVALEALQRAISVGPVAEHPLAHIGHERSLVRRDAKVFGETT